MNRVDVVQLLLSNGADARVLDTSERGPIYYARTDAMKQLLNYAVRDLSVRGPKEKQDTIGTKLKLQPRESVVRRIQNGVQVDEAEDKSKDLVDNDVPSERAIRAIEELDDETNLKTIENTTDHRDSVTSGMSILTIGDAPSPEVATSSGGFQFRRMSLATKGSNTAPSRKVSFMVVEKVNEDANTDTGIKNSLGLGCNVLNALSVDNIKGNPLKSQSAELKTEITRKTVQFESEMGDLVVMLNDYANKDSSLQNVHLILQKLQNEMQDFRECFSNQWKQFHNSMEKELITQRDKQLSGAMNQNNRSLVLIYFKLCNTVSLALENKPGAWVDLINALCKNILTANEIEDLIDKVFQSSDNCNNRTVDAIQRWLDYVIVKQKVRLHMYCNGNMSSQLRSIFYLSPN